jgi:hypothetical protein
MDPLAAFVLSVFSLGFALGVVTDRVIIPWGAHLLAGRLRSHVRIR